MVSAENLFCVNKQLYTDIQFSRKLTPLTQQLNVNFALHKLYNLDYVTCFMALSDGKAYSH